jgi:hypothetical protein
MDPAKLIISTHKPSTAAPKPPAPPAVVAMRAGLHPMSKTVQALMGANKKKGS